MMQSGPRNLADRFVGSLPGFSEIGTLACHREHSSTSGDKLTLLIRADASTEHRCALNGVRVIKTFDDIA